MSSTNRSSPSAYNLVLNIELNFYCKFLNNLPNKGSFRQHLIAFQSKKNKYCSLSPFFVINCCFSDVECLVVIFFILGSLWWGYLLTRKFETVFIFKLRDGFQENDMVNCVVNRWNLPSEFPATFAKKKKLKHECIFISSCRWSEYS